MNRLLLVGLFLSSLVAGAVHAAPIGLPENTGRIGFAWGGERLTVDDPDGDTKTKGTIRPFTLVYSDWLPRGGWRYWGEFYYQRTTLEASQTEVGQDVRQIGARFSVQKSVRLAAKFAPWFGLGLDVSQARYTDRHKLDLGGFRVPALEFGDRTKVHVNALVNVIAEWKLNRRWAVGAKLEHSQPLGDGIRSTNASALVMFRF
ncbi:MAG TPA: hypothetical protein ENJ19_00070 [Gammaproteobacteria bacterium]|nr:hypothetical protein [Gammaproteobacteria bacterium]